MKGLDVGHLDLETDAATVWMLPWSSLVWSSLKGSLRLPTWLVRLSRNPLVGCTRGTLTQP